MSSEFIIVIAAIITAAVALATFFYKMLSDVKKDLQSQINGVKEEMVRISKRVDQLSNEVSQIKAILGNIGFVVKESEVSYKGDQGAAGSKKSK